MISENMYMQYFCSLKSFHVDLPFDASLFMDIRKRMGAERFDEFNEIVIHRSEGFKPKRKRIIKHGKDDQDKSDHPGGKDATSESESVPDKKEIPNQGKLKLDASIADQYITPPNDLKLVNKAREEAERLVDVLYTRKAALTKNLAPIGATQGKNTWLCPRNRTKAKKRYGSILGNSYGMSKEISPPLRRCLIRYRKMEMAGSF
jgi:hypothetical protein